MQAATGEPWPAAPEHASRPAEIGDVPVLLVYTDLGVDVLFDAPERDAIRDALLSAGARPVGDAAAEALRIERGRPRYGVDLDDSTIPQEADLNDRAVSFTKGCYVGQETVARLFYRGKPNRHLRGLSFADAGDGDGAQPRTGDDLRIGDRIVGHVGSVARSPRSGTIALALVRREAQPGAELLAGPNAIAARVVDLPFTP